MSPITRDAEGTVTGNTYDKYGSTNAVVRRLMATFERTVDELLDVAAPATLLDVGCGEGVLTQRWATRPGMSQVVGIDLEDPVLQAEWARRSAPNVQYRVHSAERLPFADDAFDVATAIEVLEHVPDPGQTLLEMTRVARSHVLVSVPREPLWRALNLARGAYVGQLGNTPGHVNHWSRRSFVSLLTRYGRVVEARSPLPWTVVLVSVS